MSHLQAGTVKVALSGDSLILRGAQRGNQPPPERTLSLAYIHAPHMGSIKRGTADEPFSFESREFLRRRIAGKAVRFRVAYQTQSGREYGMVYLGPDMHEDNVAALLVREGWAQVTDQAKNKLKRTDTSEEDADMIDFLLGEEDYAKRGRRGMWDERARDARPRQLLFEDDPSEFLATYKSRELRATVEHVRDATTIRVVLHLPKAHQTVTVLLAGVRAPSLNEPFGEEAKYNVEIRLLQQDVRVKLEGLPQGQSSPTGTFAGTIIHPAGNMSEWLLSSGYARVADWSAPLVQGGSAQLRGLEKTARSKRLRIWKNAGPEADIPDGPADTIEGTVVRVVSGDTVVVHDSRTKTDREFQLASVRQPRVSDPDQAGYSERARESLRKLCIGRIVSVAVDYHKPAQDGFRARDCATIRYRGEDLGVHLAKQGLVGVLRYRNGSDDGRSSNYDELLAAESQAQQGKLGIHSGKSCGATKLTDASESAVRARSFITHWQRSGRVPCVVEYVSSGSRLRLAIPKERVKLAFVLGGVRCPRGPRPSDKGEPWGAEALELTTHSAMQRNVEVEFEGVDKSGAFIGTVWLAKDRNLAEDLLEAGLATVHGPAADNSPHGARLYAAERSAQTEQRGQWADYDAEAAEQEEGQKIQMAEAAKKLAQQQGEKLQPCIEYLDVVVSEMASPTTFYVQIAQPDKIGELETLMADLAISQTAAIDKEFVPKTGQMVSACYTVGDEWHRARIRRVLPGKREFEVIYVDFGNAEVLSLDRIRPLPAKFASTNPHAHEAQLAFLQLPSEEMAADYMPEAFDELRRLVEGCKLVANVEARLSSGVMQLTLYDPNLGSPILEKSVNAKIAEAGFAVVDKTSLAARHNAEAARRIEELVDEARSTHRGMWEYGDVTTD